MSNIMMFENKEVEVFEFEGKVLFNPYDVGSCLDISDITVRRHIQEMNEKQVIKLKNLDVQEMNIRKLNNAGENFLTESGVYKLIFKSRKPDAEKFQDWVTDEVLPSIRKHGGYIANQENLSDEELLAKALIVSQNIINEKNKMIQEMQPKANYYDKLIDKELLLNFRNSAKELGIKQKEFINILLDKKILYRDSKNKLLPYAKYVDKGYFEIKEGVNSNISYSQTFITVKGREYLIRLLDK